MTASHKNVPWLLWPFYAICWLVAFILESTGRLVGAILAVIFIILGIILTITFVGAIVGIPMTILGIGMLIRCFSWK